MKKTIKIVHIPFSKRNPYQKLLADNLLSYGVEIKGATVHHLKNISFLNLSLFSLLIKHWKPDIVHLHWQSSFIFVDGSRFKTILKSLLFIFQLWMLKKLGIKIVWTVHNLKRHEETFRDLEAYFTKSLSKLSDKIIVHCKSAADDLRNQFGPLKNNQIAIIPHGHFIDYYPNKITSGDARNKLGLSSSNFTFLFIGEVRYYKGVLELIDAFKSLDYKDTKLIIAGRPIDDKMCKEIKLRIEKITNIHVRLAYVPDDEMQVYINASDVIVFPYRNIFTSGGIFLGLSFGKPIIAPKTGCITDTLKASSNFLYDSNCKNGLLSAMKDSIESVKTLDDIGKENLAIARMYGWDEIAAKTLEHYFFVFKKK